MIAKAFTLSRDAHSLYHALFYGLTLLYTRIIQNVKKKEKNLMEVDYMEWTDGTYTISNDHALLSVKKIKDLLSNSYWADNRSLEVREILHAQNSEMNPVSICSVL